MRQAADWRPKLVALDVDGTIVDWVDGVETMSAAVRDAVLRAAPRAPTW